MNEAEANFPALATAATVEKIEGKKGLELRATGSDGRPVDIEALHGEDRVKQPDAFGALDAPLARHLDGLADDERVPVAIWLVEPERMIGERPEEGAGSDDVDRLALFQTERRAAQVAEVTTPLLERLRGFDEEAAASTSSPLVWATVPAGLVREMAKDERVDTIYGDLERGGPETNLSREVVGANLAPADTHRGTCHPRRRLGRAPWHRVGPAAGGRTTKTTPKRPRVAPKRPRNGVFPGILALYESVYLQGFPSGALSVRGIIIRVSGVRVPPPA